MRPIITDLHEIRQETLGVIAEDIFRAEGKSAEADDLIGRVPLSGYFVERWRGNQIFIRVRLTAKGRMVSFSPDRGWGGPQAKPIDPTAAVKTAAKVFGFTPVTLMVTKGVEQFGRRFGARRAPEQEIEWMCVTIAKSEFARISQLRKVRVDLRQHAVPVAQTGLDRVFDESNAID